MQWGCLTPLTYDTIMSGRLKHASNSIIFSSSQNARDVVYLHDLQCNIQLVLSDRTGAGPGFRQYRLLDRFRLLSVDNINLVRVTARSYRFSAAFFSACL